MNVVAANPNPVRGFEHELIARSPRLTVKSTCMQCGASTVGSFDDGSIESWEGTHDCWHPPKLTLLHRLRSWLFL